MTPSTEESPGVVAIVTRGDGVDAVHYGAVAVVDESGRVSHAYGDPALSTMARSAIKPFQALPLITTGAADALGLDDEELAIACASHSGDDEHVRVVERLLDKAGASAADLQCGAHSPIGLRMRGRAPLAGEDRDPLRNNCSGKHAGFLALCRQLGVERGGYLAPDGPVQTLVREHVAEACGVDAASMPRGIDGCSAPNYALPLLALARGMNTLMRPERAGSGALQAALRRLRDALLAHPRLVSGEGRFDHELATAYRGELVSKVGAEGLELVALRRPAVAFAVKIRDGAERALPPVCVAVLEQLGVDPAPSTLAIGRHTRPVIRNHRQIATGEIRSTIALSPWSR